MGNGKSHRGLQKDGTGLKCPTQWTCRRAVCGLTLISSVPVLLLLQKLQLEARQVSAELPHSHSGIVIDRSGRIQWLDARPRPPAKCLRLRGR